MFKKLVGILLATALVGICSAGLLYMHLISWAQQPAGTAVTEKLFTVTPGQGLRKIADELRRAGLVSDALRFTLLARIKNKDKLIKAGEYAFATTLSPNEILDQMVAGRVHLYRLTIPEGFNLVQIAGAVSAAGLASEADFLAAARDSQTAEALKIHGKTVEGYLFPDTYYFPLGIDSTAIITALVRRFEAAYKPEWRRRSEALGLSVHEVVTLASIIEKETGDPAERPLIASVFHNRLKKGMRLETDPTVIYGIEDFDGNLTRKHLRTPTPYNTYVIKGLPPGPIASPGHAALEAALYPAETDYLFFVSRRDRTHQFSSNLEDHRKAVRKYQLRRRRKSS